MQWKDLAGVVGKAAPIVGGLLGGPLGATAGGLIAKALGVAPFPDAIADVLKNDPTAALKLADLQSNERLRLAELTNQHFEIEARVAEAALTADNDDRASARAREIAAHDTTPRNLAYSVTAGLFLMIAVILFRGLPVEGRDAILMLLTAMVSGWTAIMAYYFGSSSGSALKTAMLAKGGRE